MLRGPEIPTGAIVVRAGWADNPWFTPELEQERQDCLRMNPEQYDHIWEGGYAQVIAGAYYARQLAEARARADRPGRGRSADDAARGVRHRRHGGEGGRGGDLDRPVRRPRIALAGLLRGAGQPLAAHVAWLRANG